MAEYTMFSFDHASKLRIKTMLLGILIIIFSHKATAKDSATDGNHFMEDLINIIKTDRSAVYSIDPLTVPDMKSNNFETKNLVVKGLSKLYRLGNCTVSDSDSGSSSVTCKMEADDLFVDFDYWAKALFFWFNGEGTVKVDKLIVEMDISFVSNKASLDKLTIMKLGDFHVQKINGLSVLLNWMLKYIAESVFTRAKDRIKFAVTRSTSQAVKELMEEKSKRFLKSVVTSTE